MRLRPPAQIPGYTPVKQLGSGSEADVYLYQQHFPARQVAIKISKRTLDPQAAASFRTEANFMGQVSSHPYILSVFDSGVTADGRGYAVFEYAPGGNYKTFLEHDRLSADEMLTVGIDLASALFTAHRKGIVHRDIKPSNILINAQRMPLLADFGIAGSIYGGPGVGFTIAWAPPEVLSRSGGGNESSDIFSLAATLFALVMGKSPYEYAYADLLGDARGADRAKRLQQIVCDKPLPAFHCPEIPAPVGRVLRQALSYAPEDRYYSALEFARAMQRVQREVYGHAMRTTVEGVPDFPPDMRQRRESAAKPADLPRTRRSWGRPLAVTLAVIAALAAVMAVFVVAVAPHMDATSDTNRVQVHGSGSGGSVSPRNDSDPDAAVSSGSVPSVTGLAGTYSASGNTVTFTWTNPSPRDGDAYAWSPVGDAENSTDSQGTITESTSVEVDASGEVQTCIQVSLIRKNRQMSDTPAIACATRP